MLWVHTPKYPGNGSSPTNGDLFPYVIMSGAAFLLTFVPIIGINAGSFTIAVVLACVVLAPLGMIIGFFWTLPSWHVGVLGGIPAWLFLLAFYNWSVMDMLSGTMDNVPVLSLPIACMLGSYVGAYAGRKIATHRKVKKGFSQRQ